MRGIDVAISDDEWEDGLSADHVYDPITLWRVSPIIAVAVAGGNRISLHLALRHRSVMRGMVLC